MVIELGVVENGSAIQSALEDSTGKSTVPNVWLDGKFIGGSEEVLKGVEDGMFDAVEKKEVIVMEEEEKVPIVQGPDCIKVGDKVRIISCFWQPFCLYYCVNMHCTFKDESERSHIIILPLGIFSNIIIS